MIIIIIIEFIPSDIIDGNNRHSRRSSKKRTRRREEEVDRKICQPADLHLCIMQLELGKWMVRPSSFCLNQCTDTRE